MDAGPYVIANFYKGGGGVSDQNEKLVGKDKGFPNFSPSAGFFRYGGTEKPLETVKFQKFIDFLKMKDPNFFFASGGLLFRNIGRTI